jgi:hypothetical protein
MKRILVIYTVFAMVAITMLFCSCTKKNEPSMDEAIVMSIDVNVVFVDKFLNDRLDPKSPSYFGEEYAQGIKVLYLCDGKKLGYLDYYHFMGRGEMFYIENIENRKTISEPHWDSFEHYFISCISRASIMEDDEEVAYAYLSYPDGSEDEIKVRLRENSGEYGCVLFLDKIWINGELAREGVTDSQMYYNPKYFPWLKPYIDDNGRQTGMISEGQGLIVLTK